MEFVRWAGDLDGSVVGKSGGRRMDSAERRCRDGDIMTDSEISALWSRFRPNLMREWFLNRSENECFVRVRDVLGYCRDSIV